MFGVEKGHFWRPSLIPETVQNKKITQKILFVQKIKIAIQTVAKVDAKLFCHKGRLDDGCNKNSKIIVVTKLQKFEKWSKIGTGSTLQIKYPKIIWFTEIIQYEN